MLIDADNVPHSKIADMLAELSKYGTANIRRAYGDWASAGLKNWKDKLHDFAIRPIQQFSYSTGKNATDIALVIDAMELLYTQELDAFCLASSDADFTPLVMQLKANGHEVYGFGERKTPAPFVNACTAFLYLDTLIAFAVASDQALFRACQLPDAPAGDGSNITAHQLLRLLYADRRDAMLPVVANLAAHVINRPGREHGGRPVESGLGAAAEPHCRVGPDAPRCADLFASRRRDRIGVGWRQ